MISIPSQKLIDAVGALSQHVPTPQRRTLELANGKQYTIIVDEVASRSAFFEAMFREKGFAESQVGCDEKMAELDLPDNDKFEHVYAFLMIGIMTEELSMPEDFVSHYLNADYLGIEKVKDHMFEEFKVKSRAICEKTPAEKVTRLPPILLTELVKDYVASPAAYPVGTKVRMTRANGYWEDDEVKEYHVATKEYSLAKSQERYPREIVKARDVQASA